MKSQATSRDRLIHMIGRERPLREITQVLHYAANEFKASEVGAIHVTCADESEVECSEAFQRGFVHYMLPPLKTGRSSPMRLANLGGQYEWGAVRIAEDHYATDGSRDEFKLMVVKINAHVARESDTHPPEWGRWSRYGRESECCGALAGLLANSHLPFADLLREDFESEGIDRLGTLKDPALVDQHTLPLLAAMVSTRLQARKVVLDTQDYEPRTPTVFMILPCVTINREGHDSEILCGLYEIDRRHGGQQTYTGLGDDPSQYRLQSGQHGLVVSDDELGTRRPARDHRALVADMSKELSTHLTATPENAATPALLDDRIHRVREDVRRGRHRDSRHAHQLLRVALPVLAEVAPIPAAILMFAEGAAGIHHTFRVHRLAREMEGELEAREILEEIESRIDHLEPERAEALLELLVADYRR